MRRLHLTKKAMIIGAAVTVVSLGLGGVAFALFTNLGSGSGSAQVGAPAQWSVSSTTTGPSLLPDYGQYPGGTAIDTIDYTVTNTASFSQTLTQVTISVPASFYSQNDPSDPPCVAADFSIDGGSIGATATDTALAGAYAAGASDTSGVAHIEMIDNSANQDNCEGLVVPISFVAS